MTGCIIKKYKPIYYKFNQTQSVIKLLPFFCIYIIHMFPVFIYVFYIHICFLLFIYISCIYMFLALCIPEFIWILCFVCLIWDFLFLMANPTDFPVQLQQICAVCILAFPVPVWRVFLLHIRVL